MALLPMRDLIIVLPGIMGSILQKHGKDIWAPSLSAAARLLQSEKLVRDLTLPANDDPDLDDLGDGIRAVALMPNLHMIPGFWKIDGYSDTVDFLLDSFDIEQGSIFDPDPMANLFAFPYDWRRDNRAIAQQLKRFVDRQLPIWREASGAHDAKVILVAHSMGGLISRYYLEVLGGWEQARALFSFGTPYRGSPKSLNFLSNGYKSRWMEATEALRSFNSAYQLLPIYRVVQREDEFLRVADLDGIEGISVQRARDALAYHEAMRQAAEQRRAIDQYRNAYLTFPVVGVRQTTLQSARMDGRRVVVSNEQSERMRRSGIPTGGDGTVPSISAVPAELANEHRELFASELHGSLQGHPDLLDQIYQHITRWQVPDWDSVLGTLAPSDKMRNGQSAITLELDDAYLADEPVTIRARLLDTADESLQLVAKVSSLAMPAQSQVHSFQRSEDAWQLTLEECPAGTYRIEVQTNSVAPGTPSPVHDLFEVAA
jgi:pimeloyl-ACP methyl ester carboxylesterase